MTTSDGHDARLTWRESVALRIMAWIAHVLLRDSALLDAALLADLKNIRTNLSLGPRSL